MNKQKILIVDDDENIAELVSLYLTKECFDTMMVHDGERALVAFDTYKPNLILLDLMLPGIDGYQVCREIRTRSNTPIIMLSAKGEVFDKVLGLELGADFQERRQIGVDGKGAQGGQGGQQDSQQAIGNFAVQRKPQRGWFRPPGWGRWGRGADHRAQLKRRRSWPDRGTPPRGRSQRARSKRRYWMASATAASQPPGALASSTTRASGGSLRSSSSGSSSRNSEGRQ